jgi:hypothetical protein
VRLDRYSDASGVACRRGRNNVTNFAFGALLQRDLSEKFSAGGELCHRDP